MYSLLVLFAVLPLSYQYRVCTNNTDYVYYDLSMYSNIDCSANGNTTSKRAIVFEENVKLYRQAIYYIDNAKVVRGVPYVDRIISIDNQNFFLTRRKDESTGIFRHGDGQRLRYIYKMYIRIRKNKNPIKIIENDVIGSEWLTKITMEQYNKGQIRSNDGGIYVWDPVPNLNAKYVLKGEDIITLVQANDIQFGFASSFYGSGIISNRNNINGCFNLGLYLICDDPSNIDATYIPSVTNILSDSDTFAKYSKQKIQQIIQPITLKYNAITDDMLKEMCASVRSTYKIILALCVTDPDVCAGFFTGSKNVRGIYQNGILGVRKCYSATIIRSFKGPYLFPKVEYYIEDDNSDRYIGYLNTKKGEIYSKYYNFISRKSSIIYEDNKYYKINNLTKELITLKHMNTINEDIDAGIIEYDKNLANTNIPKLSDIFNYNKIKTSGDEDELTIYIGADKYIDDVLTATRDFLEKVFSSPITYIVIVMLIVIGIIVLCFYVKK